MPKADIQLAILGAGPIGLEAALYARALGLRFTVYERGRLADSMWRWGHVRMFTPLSMNTTPLGRAAAKQKPNLIWPGEATCLTGREFINLYLTPISEALHGTIHADTLVLQVGRRGLHKQDDPDGAARAKQPFRLLLRDKQNRERYEEADIILDCTGTYGQHRWLGDGGMPALGEVAAEPHISYTLDDILGDRKNHYANRNILVAGGGLSAATSVVNLAQLALEQNSTWVTWIAKGSNTWPIKRIPNDPLKERDRLAVRANNLATRADANVEFHAQSFAESIEPLGQDRGFRVTLRSAGKPRVLEVERIIGNVGYTPDRLLYRELQIHECYASFGPMKLATMLREQKASGKPVVYTEELLRNPEANYFILGAKSHGRYGDFFLKEGFEQVRAVFGLIMGEGELDLYRAAKGR